MDPTLHDVAKLMEGTITNETPFDQIPIQAPVEPMSVGARNRKERIDSLIDENSRLRSRLSRSRKAYRELQGAYDRLSTKNELGWWNRHAVREFDALSSEIKNLNGTMVAYFILSLIFDIIILYRLAK